MRALIPTNRLWYRIVSAGTLVDLEDSMAALTDADVLELPPYGHRARLGGLRSGSLSRAVSVPGDEYDLCFLAIFNPEEIRSLTVIRDVRKRCGNIFVYVFDPWPSKIEMVKRYRRL